MNFTTYFLQKFSFHYQSLNPPVSVRRAGMEMAGKKVPGSGGLAGKCKQ